MRRTSEFPARGESEAAVSSAEFTRQGAPAIRARDARARRTMQLLNDALLSLVETTPFERITVDDIVERAGIGRSTFYRHFETKEALIDEIATTEIVRLVDLTFPLLNTLRRREPETLERAADRGRLGHHARYLHQACLHAGA